MQEVSAKYFCQKNEKREKERVAELALACRARPRYLDLENLRLTSHFTDISRI
jgi:hypothetical protein